MAFPVESIIRGRYLIQSQLGTGNVGDVYLVRDQLITWKSPILFAFKEVINPNRHQLYQITLDGMALRLLQHQALPVFIMCSVTPNMIVCTYRWSILKDQIWIN
jgi:hypothetical protein